MPQNRKTQVNKCPIDNEIARVMALEARRIASLVFDQSSFTRKLIAPFKDSTR